jgi:Ca2+-binding RTX toxin-like protein
VSDQPKVIISTDIGGNDKDDAQSLIHALLYADKMDYRGFIGTTSDARNIDSITPMNRIIDAYAKDLSNLRTAGDYASAAELRALITQGATQGDWPGALSDGAKLIIEEARAASANDPVYVLTWGPIHDVARALYQAPDIADNIRLISISPYKQDARNPAAYNWLKNAVANKEAYKDLWWIQDHSSHIGMYADQWGTKDPDKNMGWVRENVDGHGALGDLFHDVYAKDLYGTGTVNGMKMGDTPSLLYLLDAVNNDDPTASSWGGSFKKANYGSNVWVDRTDDASSLGNYDGARTVYQHRDAVWGEFAELLDIAKNGTSGTGGSGSTGGTTDDTTKDDPAPTPDPDPVVDDSKDGDSSGGTPDGDLTTVSGSLPTFELVGTNANDSLRGGDSIDTIYGGRGDDDILGRSKADVLAGGAGNDDVNGGADNDTLIYVIGDNFGATDFYSGAAGVDVLQIYGTAEELADSGLAADIAALEKFIAANYDTGTNSGTVFSFDSLGLSVRGVESVKLVQTDDAVTSPGTSNEGETPVDSDSGSNGSGDASGADALPSFDLNDGNSGSKILGTGSSDSINGAGGDDYIVGRGNADVLYGGSGSDQVRAGAGNDVLVYLLGEDDGASDLYVGQRGRDRLTIYGTEDQLSDAEFLAEIADLETFMSKNEDTTSHGGPTFDFDCIGLSVRAVESVDLIVVDDIPV